MWPFKKPLPLDTSDVIFLDDTGLRFLPLKCEPAILKEGIETINAYLKRWALQDLAFSTSNNQPIQATLLYQLKDIDLKYLPYPSYLTTLENCLQDTNISNSGSRLMDVIVRLEIEVPREVIDVIKGKFIASMLYGLPRVINELPLPTKDKWMDCLAKHPWVPYLTFLQELYEHDPDIGKLTEKLAEDINHVSTISTAPNYG